MSDELTKYTVEVKYTFHFLAKSDAIDTELEVIRQMLKEINEQTKPARIVAVSDWPDRRSAFPQVDNQPEGRPPHS